jgi:hypothetical protein
MKNLPRCPDSEFKDERHAWETSPLAGEVSIKVCRSCHLAILHMVVDINGIKRARGYLLEPVRL